MSDTTAKKIISYAKFNMLMKYKNTMSEEEKVQVQEFLKERNQISELPKDYFKEKPKVVQKKCLNYGQLAKAFKKRWEFNERKKLILNVENKKYYRVVTQYFAREKDFENTDLTLNAASLDKGLLLMGTYGNGKTSMMQAFHDLGMELYSRHNQMILYYRMISCNGLVREFEGLDTGVDKDDFFKRYINGTVYFDDFGTERIASNYGKSNLMKDILEERYLKNNKCHLTTNLTFEEIGEKYGGRVFDRMKEMFNVIEVPGQSFRI